MSRKPLRRRRMGKPQSEAASAAARDLESWFAEALDRCKAAGHDCNQLRVCIGETCRLVNLPVPHSSSAAQ